MRWTAALAMTMLAAIGLVSLAAQDKPTGAEINVSGSWVGEIKTPVSYSPLAISFKLEQTVEGVKGFAWPGTAQVPIQNVKRDANTLRFDISGDNIVYRFELTARGDRLEGDTHAEDHGHAWTGTTVLKREKPKENEKK